MMKKYIYVIMGVLLAQLTSGQELKFIVGTYTKKNSEGLYYVSLNTKTLDSKIISHSPKIDNPSFLDISEGNKRVYAVSETSNGKVAELQFNDKTGDFKLLKTVSSGGADPCYVALDNTKKWIFVANYSGGTLALIPNNHKIEEPKQIIQHQGSGPNTQRQEKAHIHSVNITKDNQYLIVADLGSDELSVYNFNAQYGFLKLKSKLKLSAGSGVRHLAFHPTLPIIYALQELTGKVSTLSFSNGILKFEDEISTLPADFVGKNSSADIHISNDGRFLYASNRFFDSIVSYKVNAKTGKLSTLAQTPVEGKTPRNFALSPDSKLVLVANQDSDNITIFKRDIESGLLTKTGKDIKISMPVCIKFLR